MGYMRIKIDNDVEKAIRLLAEKKGDISIIVNQALRKALPKAAFQSRAPIEFLKEGEE